MSTIIAKSTSAGNAVRSVDLSGGTTGLTTSGGPITSSGTITLSGTLATTNGGTGLYDIGTSNQLLGVSAGSTLEYKTIVAGSGIQIDHSVGSIEITNLIDSTTIPLHESGFENREDSIISFDDVTRTFTIQPTISSFSFWVNGVKMTNTTPQSVTIPDLTGIYYIYFDVLGILTASPIFTDDIITTFVFTSQIYWSTTSSTSLFIGEERHGDGMDSFSHLYLHSTVHAVYESGLALSGITSDGSGNLDGNAQFGVENGIFWDEDIQHVITGGSPQVLSTPAQIPIYYRLGATEWSKYTSPFPLIYGGVSGVGTRMNYNQNISGNWQLTQIASGRYGLVHYYATNSIETPIIGVCGQQEYTGLNAARTGAEVEASELQLHLFVTLEFVLIGTVIFQTNNSYSNVPQSRIRSTDSGEPYVDWRSTLSTTLGSNGTSWGNISGTLSNQLDLMAHLDVLVPPQLSHAGKYLTTDGINTTWENIPVFTVVSDVIDDYVSYRGKALMGSLSADPVWSIKKITIALNGTITITTVDAGNFTQIWDDRLSLIYS